MAVDVEPRASGINSDLPRRVRMSREEFRALPEDEGRAEWVDGWAIFMTVPRWSHNRTVRRLLVILDRDLAGADVLPWSGLSMDHSNRIPDIMVFASEFEDDGWWAGIPPIIAIEVLSPSTRRTDLIEKADEYVAHGVGQYWIVDPDTRTVLIRTNDDGAWRPLVSLDDKNPSIDVKVGELGTVALSQDVIFGPATA
jgi:Uma2 family endonuclease